MNLQDFLYISISIGFIILVVFTSLAAYQLTQTLKSLKIVLDSAGNISQEIAAVKNQIKNGALNALLTALNIFLKKRK